MHINTHTCIHFIPTDILCFGETKKIRIHYVKFDKNVGIHIYLTRVRDTEISTVKSYFKKSKSKAPSLLGQELSVVLQQTVSTGSFIRNILKP